MSSVAPSSSVEFVTRAPTSRDPRRCLRHPRHTYLPVPGITCACNKCPHMARNTLEKIRDCMRDGTPEIAWQPEFDKAKAVLERSLLNPPVTAPVQPLGD